MLQTTEPLCVRVTCNEYNDNGISTCNVIYHAFLALVPVQILLGGVEVPNHQACDFREISIDVRMSSAFAIANRNNLL